MERKIPWPDTVSQKLVCPACKLGLISIKGYEDLYLACTACNKEWEPANV